MYHTWKECGKHELYTQETPVWKFLVSSLNDGCAFTLLAISWNQRTTCLIVKSKQELYDKSNSKDNIVSPQGVSNICSQGSISEHFNLKNLPFLGCTNTNSHIHAKRNSSILYICSSRGHLESKNAAAKHQPVICFPFTRADGNDVY